MKKGIIKTMLLGMLLLTLVFGTAIAEDASGTDGDLSWTLTDGVLTISGNGDMADDPSWVNYASSITSVVIKNGVTSIGGYAFYYCSSLTSIEIPDSVTSIGDMAFYDCSSLTSIEIPNSVTSIGNSAFSGCSSLTSIEIPNGVTSIGDYAFLECESLTNIEVPDSVTSIGDSAFDECSNLTSIEIPNSVTSIGARAFYYCSSLTSIEIPNSITSIGDGAFASCSNLSEISVDKDNPWYCSYKGILFDKDMTELIQFPGAKIESDDIPDSVTSIGNSAFRGCESLTSIEIPNSVTSIGDWAFAYCSSLTSIEIPDSVTSIGYSAFDECSNLTSIEIPDSVTSIGEYAFYYCSSLTSIEIPDSVTSIGDRAFEGCSSLTSIEIPDSVTSIGGSAFSGCSSLTSIEIPNSVTSIGDGAFYNCSSLTSIEIPDSVTSTGDWVFEYCSSLTSIEIPESVTSISDYAFSSCYSLNEVFFLENKFPEIGYDAFGYCTCSAYYPSSWTDTPTGQYGGTITWISVDAPVVSAQPKAVSVSKGSTAKFTVEADGTKLNYQWQVSTDGGQTWKNSGLGGNKTATLSVGATEARNNYQFRCMVTDCVKQSVTSKAAKLTVLSSETISITKQPVSLTSDPGSTAKFTVAANSSLGSALTYQWQASVDGGNTWKNSGLSGNKTATLSVSATEARNNYQFRCVISSAGASITSDAATLTVNTCFNIKSQPADQTVNNSKNVKFEVSVSSPTGAALTYQWQASTDGGKTWKNSGLAGNKTKTLTVGATAGRNGYMFRCVISDSNDKSITSDAAKLTVDLKDSEIISFTSITASKTAIAGINTKYTVAAASTAGNIASYQWQVSTDGGKTWKNSGLTGNKTKTLTVGATSGRNGYRFRCVVKDDNDNTATSDVVSITVK